MFALLGLSAVLSAPVCDICNGGLLQSNTTAGNGSDADNNVSNTSTCQEAHDSIRDARPGDAGFQNCSVSQAAWGATCCATNLTSLANYADASANAPEVLAGLQLCFEYGVVADDESGSARLSNPACVTAWATLCARDEVLGEWMQKKVQSKGFRLCNQVPAWARGESAAGGTLDSWPRDTTLEMLSYAATLLGVSWFAGLTDTLTMFTDACALSFEATIGFQWMWGLWITARGARLSGNGWPSSEAALYTQLHMRLLEQKIDGPVLCSLSAGDIVQFGVPFGAAKHYQAGLDDYIYAQIETPLGAIGFDPSVGYYRPFYPPRPANVSITMVLDDLYNINELDFTFNIGFTLVLSWEDDRISTRCTAIGALGDNTLPSDPCNHYWQPKVSWPNVFQYDEGEFEVVEELGFHTEVGLGSPRAEDKNKNANLEHSIGYRVQRIKGHFVTPMGFKYFPYDCQNLIVRVRASGDDAAIYRFAPSSSIGARLSGLLRSDTRTLAGWNITAINHQERLYTSKPMFEDMGSSNPLNNAIISTIRSPTHLSDARVMTDDELQKYQTTKLIVPYYSDVSEAVFSISVRREPHSFIFNFAVLVALLLSISFSSFLLPNNDMSGRIGLALTVYLGVIFFQILIVQSLPRTNAFTTMHLFMFLSSIFNGIIVLEHVLVYALNVLVGERAERVLRIKKLKRNARAVRYAIRLQRSFRNHRINVLHREALDESSKASASAPAAASTTSSVDDSFWPMSVRVDPAVITSSRSNTPSGVDVGIARRPLRGHGHVGGVVSSYPHTAAAASPDDTRSCARCSLYSQQLELRMRMADKSFGQKPFSRQRGFRLCWREQKKAVVRKLYDFAAVFLKDANRFFTITTIASYFVGVFYLTFLNRSHGDNTKCNNPWSTLV